MRENRKRRIRKDFAEGKTMNLAPQSEIQLERWKVPNRHLNEKKIKDTPVTAVNQLVIQRNKLLASYDESLAGLTDTAALEADLQRPELEKDGILQRITDLIHENATTEMDQGEYNRRYDALEAQRVTLSEK